MNQRIGTEMLFPVYRTIREEGANLEYEVIGWVGFFITDYRRHREQRDRFRLLQPRDLGGHSQRHCWLRRLRCALSCAHRLTDRKETQ